jgi:hypothetical protein
MSILTRIQSNPEIGTSNAEYVSELITRSKAFVVDYCRLKQYPELLQGYIKGRVNPTVDLSSLATNELWVSVNGSGFVKITLTLASCTDGVATAAHLQELIRAEQTGVNTSAYLYGFDEVTVEYIDISGEDSYFQIISGRYGEDSTIFIDFSDDAKDVCQAMGLSLVYGAEEWPGGANDEDLDTALVLLVEALYVKAGVEGLRSASIFGGVSFTEQDLDPRAKKMLNRRRRIWH